MTSLNICDMDLFIEQHTPESLAIQAEQQEWLNTLHTCRSCQQEKTTIHFYEVLGNHAIHHKTCLSCRTNRITATTTEDGTIPTKHCPLCQQTLAITLFRPRSDGSGKPDSWCQKCTNEYSRKQRFLKMGKVPPPKKEAVVSDGFKTCCHCKVEKPLSDFYVDRSKKDGHTGRCKECMSA